MNVRKFVKTTISLIFLATGFVFLRLYYVRLLSMFLNFIYKSDQYFDILNEKLFPIQYIGSYICLLFYICVVAIFIARFYNAITKQKYGLKVLSSFKQPLILTGIVTITLSINILNIFQLWSIFYIFLIICLHSTFKLIISQTESIGSYPNLRLFKNYVLTIKSTIEDAISSGFSGFNNPVDETFLLLISGTLLLLKTTVFISFIIYMTTHWRFIFLSHLINMG